MSAVSETTIARASQFHCKINWWGSSQK